MASLRLLFDIALTHLRTRRRQTVVSVLGVAVGVGFSIAIMALMSGFQLDFIERIIDATPHVVMKDEQRFPPLQPVERLYGEGAIELRGVKPEEEVRGIRRPRMVIAAIARMEGVEAAPTLQGEIVMSYGGKDVSATLYGIEPERERRVTRLEDDLIAGTLDALATAANGILVGAGIAERLAIGMHDTLSVASPAGVLMRMKVVGIFETGIIALDDQVAYVLLKKAQVLLNRPNVINRVRMRVDDVDRADVFAARVEGLHAYRTESWKEANEGVLSIFVVQNVIRFSVSGALIVVAAFGIFNVISTVVLEKSRDIAILKSIGFAEGDIRAIFLLEGFAVGVPGAVLGWLLGYGLTRALDAFRIPIEGIIRLEKLVLYYSPLHYAIVGGVALAAAVLAAYLPARRAARLNPIDIVRGAA